MNKVLNYLPFAIAYLGDIIIYSKTADHLQQVFHKLCNAELTLKLSKCQFFAKKIQYLGHVLSTTDIKPLPSKTVANKLMNSPKNVVCLDIKPPHSIQHSQSAFLETPILHYPDPPKYYIVYTDASDDACGAQLHSFYTHLQKWSTTEQEAYDTFYFWFGKVQIWSSNSL